MCAHVTGPPKAQLASANHRYGDEKEPPWVEAHGGESKGGNTGDEGKRHHLTVDPNDQNPPSTVKSSFAFLVGLVGFTRDTQGNRYGLLLFLAGTHLCLDVLRDG